nr:MAG TPA: hypothetical protein [Caudoviricetes sp.]
MRGGYAQYAQPSNHLNGPSRCCKIYFDGDEEGYFCLISNSITRYSESTIGSAKTV